MSTQAENLVILAQFPTDLEAAMVIAALEREDIEAFMKGEYTASFRAEAPSWPKVEVRETDYKRARAILDTFQKGRLKESPADTDESLEEPARSNWNWLCRELVVLYLIGVGLTFAYSFMQLFGWL